MGLLRYQIFLSYGIVFIAIWQTLLKQEDTVIKSASEKLNIPSFHLRILIEYAPIWLIVSLGVYAVSSIGISMLNFKDCPEAAAEIDQQVKQAKAELTKMGVKL